jgi:hypothetical protein
MFLSGAAFGTALSETAEVCAEVVPASDGFALDVPPSGDALAYVVPRTATTERATTAERVLTAGIRID